MRFRPGAVITVAPGREENLRRAAQHLQRLHRKPERIVVVYDGCEPVALALAHTALTIQKHRPGLEQPRNVGVEALRRQSRALTHVWFLDSDLIFEPDILERYAAVGTLSPRSVLIGPYDWLAPGRVRIEPELRNDPRWASFDAHGAGRVFRADIGAGLACFGGNLVWPILEFEALGGFHPDLHHGRCEDGELGMRAAAAGVPMRFVRDARAWHVHHPVDLAAVHARNARDVPLIDEWHPWVRGEGLIPVPKDGIRFDWRCPDCGESVNSLEYWPHKLAHRTP